MFSNFKKIPKDKLMPTLLFGFIAVVFLYYIFQVYSKSRGGSGMEFMSGGMSQVYSNSGMSSGSGSASSGSMNSSMTTSGVTPAYENIGRNEHYSSASGLQTDTHGGRMNGMNMTNPADLLPKDQNAGWAQLNPTGNGPLENINLLKSGHFIGVDTIGSSLKNANLQLRSEPPNPQQDVSIWNKSTIEYDKRPTLEIGQGMA